MNSNLQLWLLLNWGFHSLLKLANWEADASQTSEFGCNFTAIDDKSIFCVSIIIVCCRPGGGRGGKCVQLICCCRDQRLASCAAVWQHILAKSMALSDCSHNCKQMPKLVLCCVEGDTYLLKAHNCCGRSVLLSCVTFTGILVHSISLKAILLRQQWWNESSKFIISFQLLLKLIWVCISRSTRHTDLVFKHIDMLFFWVGGNKESETALQVWNATAGCSPAFQLSDQSCQPCETSSAWAEHSL